MRSLILAICCFATAACALTSADRRQIAEDKTQDQARLAKALAGLVPGEPQSCISLTLINSPMHTEAYGSTILYRVSPSLIYRTDTAGGCERISSNRAAGDVLVTRTPTGQLCRGDIAQTYDAVARIPTGGCSFGDFVAYRKPKS